MTSPRNASTRNPLPATPARLLVLALAVLALAVFAGCGGAKDGDASKPAPGASTPVQGALVLSKAQFDKITDENGKSRFVPGPAKLVIARPGIEGWTQVDVEDPESNVFHKAAWVTLPGGAEGLLTIGANAAPKPAHLKLWSKTGNSWTGETLATAEFGGKFNRYRDYEIGDVDGDGTDEIAMATHDQGAVFVLEPGEEGWEPVEIDHHENMFVHEIELGDVDGDGKVEIFATPSEPNRVDGSPQPGWIVRFDHQEDGSYERMELMRHATRHIKEILLTDVEGDGTLELYASVEATLGKGAGAGEKLEIRRYDPNGTGEDFQTVATLDDKQCRFLTPGDVDGDGQTEIVATAYKSGVWLLEPGPEAWSTTLVDADSAGYEHASDVADLDADGTPEIYVAADNQGQVRRYTWNGSGFDREVLFDTPKSDITFGLYALPGQTPASP